MKNIIVVIQVKDEEAPDLNDEAEVEEWEEKLVDALDAGDFDYLDVHVRD